MVATGGAVRFTLPAERADEALEDSLFERLAGIPCSFSRGQGGDLRVWAAIEDEEVLSAALAGLGFADIPAEPEPARDWVAEAASLRKAVAVGQYLLDPHEGERAMPAGGRTRLHLPAERAFGTGSHESTRLALRLLLHESLAGAMVLDVGCGAGTLGFVAELQQAARIVALDIDLDAAVATARQASANRLSRVLAYAGPLEALRPRLRFNVVLANLLLEEARPLVPGIAALLPPGGRLVASGLLLAQEAEHRELLERSGLTPVRMAAEGEWLAVTAERSPARTFRLRR